MGVERLVSEERLRELGTAQPTDEKAHGALISVYTYLMGGRKADRARFFSVVPIKRIIGNGRRLKHRNYHLNVIFF